MTGNRWTLLLIRDTESPVRQYSFSRRNVVWALRLGALALVLLVAGFGILGTGAVARVQADLLRGQNDALQSQLGALRTEVTALEGSLEDLAERDASMRGLAGLESIDDEVLRVGVGGPGLETPEMHPLFALDPALGESVFAVSYDLEALQRRARLLSESMAEAADSLRAHRDLLEAIPSILPAAGWLSSRFSAQRLHPVHHRPLPHEGIDIAAPKGTPILASAKGRVVKAGWLSGYGQVVEIDHGYGYATFYGHASKVLVRQGEIVERGEVIAQVGNTGIATSSHLHYEVRVNGRPQNPMNFVLPGVFP